MQTSTEIQNRQLRQHRPMVARMAYHMVSRLPACVDVDDLIQVGMMGLNEAISRCEPSEGDLERFAKLRIRGAMIDELRELDWASRNCRRSGRLIEEAQNRLQHRLCRRPFESELAAELGMSLDELRSVIDQVHRSQIVRLDDLNLLGSEDEDSADDDLPAHQLFGDWNADPLSMLHREQRQLALANAIEGLPPREQEVMKLHYHSDMKFKDIGQKLGVSESRICQIHRHAVELLRLRLQNH
jgi:RNA polymerase sigma factor for flagellar operon FliA